MNKKLSHEPGFTLVELLIAIAIIGILMALIIPNVVGMIESAQETVLQNNTDGVARIITMYSVDYDKDEWYGAWNNDGDSTLNNRIELELETISNGTHSNTSNIQNPFSKNNTILDYNNTLSSGDGYRPAVFLTANSAYAYEGTGSTKNIIGTIVAYFKVSGGTTEYIQVYYVNKDGTKSAMNKILE